MSETFPDSDLVNVLTQGVALRVGGKEMRVAEARSLGKLKVDGPSLVLFDAVVPDDGYHLKGIPPGTYPVIASTVAGRVAAVCLKLRRSLPVAWRHELLEYGGPRERFASGHGWIGVMSARDLQSLIGRCERGDFEPSGFYDQVLDAVIEYTDDEARVVKVGKAPLLVFNDKQMGGRVVSGFDSAGERAWLIVNGGRDPGPFDG